MYLTSINTYASFGSGQGAKPYLSKPPAPSEFDKNSLRHKMKGVKAVVAKPPKLYPTGTVGHINYGAKGMLKRVNSSSFDKNSLRNKVTGPKTVTAKPSTIQYQYKTMAKDKETETPETEKPQSRTELLSQLIETTGNEYEKEKYKSFLSFIKRFEIIAQKRPLTVQEQNRLEQVINMVDKALETFEPSEEGVYNIEQFEPVREGEQGLLEYTIAREKEAKKEVEPARELAQSTQDAAERAAAFAERAKYFYGVEQTAIAKKKAVAAEDAAERARQAAERAQLAYQQLLPEEEKKTKLAPVGTIYAQQEEERKKAYDIQTNKEVNKRLEEYKNPNSVEAKKKIEQFRKEREKQYNEMLKSEWAGEDEDMPSGYETSSSELSTIEEYLKETPAEEVKPISSKKFTTPQRFAFSRPTDRYTAADVYGEQPKELSPQPAEETKEPPMQPIEQPLEQPEEEEETEYTTEAETPETLAAAPKSNEDIKLELFNQINPTDIFNIRKYFRGNAKNKQRPQEELIKGFNNILNKYSLSLSTIVDKIGEKDYSSVVSSSDKIIDAVLKFFSSTQYLKDPDRSDIFKDIINNLETRDESIIKEQYEELTNPEKIQQKAYENKKIDSWIKNATRSSKTNKKHIKLELMMTLLQNPQFGINFQSLPKYKKEQGSSIETYYKMLINRYPTLKKAILDGVLSNKNDAIVFSLGDFEIKRFNDLDEWLKKYKNADAYNIKDEDMQQYVSLRFNKPLKTIAKQKMETSSDYVKRLIEEHPELKDEAIKGLLSKDMVEKQLNIFKETQLEPKEIQDALQARTDAIEKIEQQTSKTQKKIKPKKPVEVVIKA